MNLRVLSRNGNALRSYLKLVRRTIISVVYDTEHDVVFERHSRTWRRAAASTKIAEEGGTDRGFLWRLNSYWRYSQMGSDVRIDLESISLSRDAVVCRSMAEPLISRIARESVTRTLSSSSYLEKSGPGLSTRRRPVRRHRDQGRHNGKFSLEPYSGPIRVAPTESEVM